jgi:hypothetical protein
MLALNKGAIVLAEHDFSYSESIYNIGAKTRRYEFEIYKEKEERRRQYTGNSMAYWKWFTGKPKTVQRGSQNQAIL